MQAAAAEKQQLEERRRRKAARLDAATALPDAAASRNDALPSFDAVLAPLTQRALVMLPAQGTAVALCAGEAFVCRAAAGDIAPDVGVTVDVSAGLTGECVRTGRKLLCPDTAKDPRVHPSVAEAGIRGVLIAPVVRNDAVLGVVEAFSNQPQTFRDADLVTIARVAEEVGKLLPADHPGWPIAPSALHSGEDIPKFLGALTLPQPPKSKRLWVAGAVLASAVAALTFTVTRSHETFVAPAPVSETSVVNRQHLEAIKASAEQGNVGAQSILALFYWTGRGVKQDNEAAYKWSAIAADNGDANSKERLQMLRGQMQPDSIARAEAAKAKWQREHADVQVTR